MNRISVVPISSSIRRQGEIQEKIDRFLKELNTIEGFEFSVSQLDKKDGEAEVLLVLGGGTETKVVEYVEDKSDPVIMLAHPLNNSLPAALEILAYLQGMGRKAVLVQIFGNWKSEFQKLLTIYIAGNNLKQKRIGWIGHDEFTRYPFQYSAEELIRKNWGPEILDISFNEIEERFERFQGDPHLVEIAEEVVSNSTGIVEPSLDDIRGAAAIYFVLKDIINEYKIDAVAIKCFDLLPVLKNTACYALARLNEEGVIAACEGDIISATGMLIVKELTSELSFMANPTMLDIEKGLITLAHCTIPRTMCTSYKLRSHFESGIGVAYQGNMYEDQYTLFRIGGKNLQEMYTALTSYQNNGDSENLCRTQVTLRFNNINKAEQLLNRPLGNHHLVIRGDHEKKLLKYYSLFQQKDICNIC